MSNNWVIWKSEQADCSRVITNGIIAFSCYPINKSCSHDITEYGYRVFSSHVLEGAVDIYHGTICFLGNNLYDLVHSIIHSNLKRVNDIYNDDFETRWWRYSRTYLERQLHFLREKSCQHINHTHC